MYRDYYTLGGLRLCLEGEETEPHWTESRACQPFFDRTEVVDPLTGQKKAREFRWRSKDEKAGEFRWGPKEEEADHTIRISYDFVQPQPPAYAVRQNCICRWRDHRPVPAPVIRERLHAPDQTPEYGPKHEVRPELELDSGHEAKPASELEPGHEAKPASELNSGHESKCGWESGSGERFCLLQSYDHQYASFVERQGNLTWLHLTQAYRGNISSQKILEESGLFDLLADYEMLVLHSAYIITPQGQAILFSGPSGAGKSTQAELWESYAGAKVVNGDRALIRIQDGTAHGIFYAGTSGICRNLSAPVRAIVFPRKGEENRVTPIHPRQAFLNLLSQCSYYTWASDSTERMMELAARLAERVPVYSLECRRDQGAVRALAECLCI